MGMNGGNINLAPVQQQQDEEERGNLGVAKNIEKDILINKVNEDEENFD